MLEATRSIVTGRHDCHVKISHLHKSFGSVVAVKDVSIEVSPGEFLALLGPSGSGKTTLLMAVSGFDFPDSGQIEIGGEDVTWTAPNKRDLGMVFQRYTLFPHMSVLDNIAFPLRMRKIGRAERRQRAQAALKTVRLEGYGDRMPAQLSGGQQQRVALARAIVYNPKVLLMDEPLSALDKKLREEMQVEIKHLQRELGITVIFVTHDQTEALTMADRIAVLNFGELQQVGSPKELYERPASAFVAGFIGETNFWPARAKVDAAAGTEAEVELDGGDSARVLAVHALRRGQAAQVAIRPEHIKLAPTGIGATVEDAIYAGSITTLLARTRGPTLRVRLETPDATAVGTVAVGWEARNARAYAAS
jgi:putative spermidine/putrescine transport system ATP-binding protein/mannopine transport system ATP-binding protein